MLKNRAYLMFFKPRNIDYTTVLLFLILLDHF
ncbi:hypothetical protein GGR97_000003 [Wenyingzhuangia aestuarii]|nr:hypothetical protein [Wenyingzhuangia aestuarii]